MTSRPAGALARARSAASAGPSPAPIPRRRAAERGSGTVLILTLVGALIVLLPMALGVVTAVQAAQRARAAADLGAIAAAASYVHGNDAATACRRGAQLVAANRATPTGCFITPEGRTRISAEVGVRIPLFGWRTTSGSARAGPVLTGAG